MPSTISGNVGAANSGAIVTAIPLVSAVAGQPGAGRSNMSEFTTIPSSDVATAAGAFSIGGLVAGTYRVKAVLANGNISRQAGSDVSSALFSVVITVDGSSTFNI